MSKSEGGMFVYLDARKRDGKPDLEWTLVRRRAHVVENEAEKAAFAPFLWPFPSLRTFPRCCLITFDLRRQATIPIVAHFLDLFPVVPRLTGD